MNARSWKPRGGLKAWLPAMVAGLVLAALVAGLALWPRGPQLPDFAAIEDVEARKRAFFGFLAPIVRAENRRVLKRRARLLDVAGTLADDRAPGWLERRWLRALAREYEVEWNPDAPMEGIRELRRRVDIVPVPLALVQAATESGWGRSRFAVEGNNLFGHWCYEPGCGLVPARRAGDASHEVAAFDSVRQSVARYLHNLNTHRAYAPLRRIRAALRRAGKRPTAMALAEGLIRYSERREAYVEEIRQVIRINRPIIDEVLDVQ